MAASGIGNIGLIAPSALATAAVSASSAASASAAGAANSQALGQDLHVFMQALYQALSDTDSTSAHSPTYSKGQSASARGLYGRIESLIGSAQSLDGLQTAFSRVMLDLGTGTPGQGSDLTLRSWLQGLQQSVQQGTSPLSSLGSIVDVVV
jgi:hypothetical protein